MPRRSNLVIASPRTRAPVTSSVEILDSRMMTTLTVAISVSSNRNRCAAAKNRGPSIR